MFARILVLQGLGYEMGFDPGTLRDIRDEGDVLRFTAETTGPPATIRHKRTTEDDVQKSLDALVDLTDGVKKGTPEFDRFELIRTVMCALWDEVQWLRDLFNLPVG